jgi:hypothetical protein
MTSSEDVVDDDDHRCPLPKKQIVRHRPRNIICSSPTRNRTHHGSFLQLSQNGYLQSSLSIDRVDGKKKSPNDSATEAPAKLGNTNIM